MALDPARLTAFVEASNAVAGEARPVYCTAIVDADRHRLLWVADDLALCAGGGHPGIVWRLVFDRPLKKWSLRVEHSAAMYKLALETLSLRIMLGELRRESPDAGARESAP